MEKIISKGNKKNIILCIKILYQVVGCSFELITKAKASLKTVLEYTARAVKLVSKLLISIYIFIE